MLNRKLGMWLSVFLAGLGLTLTQPATAALTDIANAPISNNSGTVVKPNVMFVLDDSGSMDFNYLPDNVSNTSSAGTIYNCRLVNGGSTKCSGGRDDGAAMVDGGDPPFYSFYHNATYYNPNITYTPPVNPCDPTSNLPSQTTWTAVRTNGHTMNTSCG